MESLETLLRALIRNLLDVLQAYYDIFRLIRRLKSQVDQPEEHAQKMLEDQYFPKESNDQVGPQ
jgi:HEPN domain-containing protein